MRFYNMGTQLKAAGNYHEHDSPLFLCAATLRRISRVNAALNLLSLRQNNEIEIQMRPRPEKKR